MMLPEVEKIAVKDIELSEPIADLELLRGYEWLCGLVRLRGVPVGRVVVSVQDGTVAGSVLRDAIFHQLKLDLTRLSVERLLASPVPDEFSFADATRAVEDAWPGPWPMVTVAVCTRDRPRDLERCIAGLLELDYPNLDLLVVDNAPQTNESARVAARFPQVRYVVESRPGLDWARNRAIAEAHGEIVAYTDDDVVVDRGWVRALAAVFAEHPEVMAVTGLVVPLQLETAAQVQFERQGGFGRGFQRGWFGINLAGGERAATRNAGTGKFGTGANMAYRKSVFDRIGLFDPALDVGTVTNGGGDLEMFFRVLKGGFLLVYEPSAMVRHRHRLEYSALRAQIANNGVGFYSYLVRGMLHFPEERPALARTALWWLAYWSGRRLVVSSLRARPVLRDLATAEFFGSFSGLGTYQRARVRARELANGSFQNHDQITAPRAPESPEPSAMAVRCMDVRALGALTDVTKYPMTRVFVSWRGRMLGYVDIANLYCPISLRWLRDAIAQYLWLPIAEVATEQLGVAAIDAVTANLFSSARSAPASATAPAALAPEVSASIVIATFDRPNDLRTCLRSMTKLDPARRIEIVVVDNHPSSGLTPPVVAEFPSVKLVSEPRQGLSYARNCGILSSSGEIVISTDDDVVAPSDWVERLLAPFARPEVHAVTGNTLPIELETPPQQLFERYGGLGRGYEPREYGPDWFRSHRKAVPTWTLGATANAAFRASIFRDPAIGLLDEALGPGTPTGVGEDTYLFYKLLKAGHTLVYEPSAIVWHRHRSTMQALRRQIFNYSKGHVAYHLHTLLRDADVRSLTRLFGQLPSWRARQLVRGALDELRGKNEYPLSLSLVELGGNLLGPVELLRSYLRVRRLGTSAAHD